MTDARRLLEADVARSLGSPAEARWLVEEVLGSPGSQLGAREIGGDQAARVRALTAARRAGRPLQYVLGHWSFRSLDLVVDGRVLIPRPETEQVVDVALAELAAVAGDRDDPVVVDLGTGSGAMALATASELAAARPRLEVWATDVDGGALEVAATNRDRLGGIDPGAAERVRLRRGHWFEALPSALRGRVDLLMANPPYVAEAEWGELQPEVRHEPHRALVAPAGSDGTPGLAAVEEVVVGAAAWLARPGAAVVELAPHQAAAATRLACAAGYTAVEVRQDLAGRDRVLVCRQ